MTTKPEPRRRRGTPISDSLGADLHTLGTVLANHTRGLDDYLQRQAARIEERHGNLLAETAGLLLPAGLDLDSLTAGELQDLCRQNRLRGWSKLRRSDLIAFLRERLDPQLQARSGPATSYPSDASRHERLLLLLLRQLGTASEAIDDAWRDPVERNG
jgi:hypothetical protein